MSDEKEILDANEAVEYLAKRWGIESYSLVAFRSLRFRYNIQPAFGSKTATFWRKSDLDQIPKPDRSKPRGPRKRIEVEGDESGNSSVVLMSIGLRSGLLSVSSNGSRGHSTRELAGVS